MARAAARFVVSAAARCRTCALTVGVDARTYLLDAAGVPVFCPPPVAAARVRAITGLTPQAARASGRIGVLRDCLCVRCGHCFRAGVGGAAARCPACRSADVRAGAAAVGVRCPRCRQGRLVEDVFGVT